MNRFRNLMSWVTVALLLAGCADQHTPMEPSAPVEASRARMVIQSTEGSRLDVLATFRAKPQITIAWAKKWIGPEGGRLDFHGFTIVVPKGAVSKVTQFSIQLPVDPKGSQRVLAEFGPHNTTFAAPVTIGLPMAGTSIEGSTSPVVLWWNGAKWVNMGGRASADGSQLFTETTHFSEYGASQMEYSGGVVASGG